MERNSAQMPNKNVIKKSALAPTVLIAGGAGFIGSHLAESLLLNDARVIVLDNFTTGRDFYIGHLLTNPKFSLFDVDINASLPPEIESADYVIHLAGLEEYLYSEKQINLDALLTNAVGTKNLLDFANKSKAKFLLASSIYVYQGMMSQINLEQYFGRTNMEEKKYSSTEAKRYAEALVWEYFKKNNTDVRIVRMPEIYGPKMDLDSSGNLGRLLKELMDNKDLTIYGEGVEKEYYLYISDAVAGIAKALFNDRAKGKIFSLTPPEPYSVLEISFLLKALANHPIKVNFRSRNKEMEPKQAFPDTSNLRDLKWDVKTSFKEGIVKTLTWYGYDVNHYSFKPAKLIEEKRNEKKNNELSAINTLADISPVAPLTEKKQPLLNLNLDKLKPTGVKPVKKKFLLWSGIPALILSLLLYFVGFPAFSAYKNVKQAVTEVKEVPSYMIRFDPEKARDSSEKAFQHFFQGQKAFNKLSWIFRLTGKGKEFDSYDNTLSSAVYSSRAAYYFSKALIPFGTLWESMRPDSNKEFNRDEFSKYQEDFSVAKNNIQLAQAQFKHVDPADFPQEFRSDVTSYGNLLDTAVSNMDIFSSGLASVPDVIGLEGPRKYLILFQNNNEIRPTGGFIGSYALLELENGKIANLNIDDIYNPDGQIDVKKINTGEPPLPIKTFLDEDKLYIRNANWDPSFPDSAQQIMKMYSEVTGTQIDGAVAIDLYLAKSLLKVTGPIFLTAYNEEISADNLYERTQFHSEFNYTNGSDQKKSFLTILGSKLLEKLFSLPSDRMPQMWNELYSSLNQRHIMIYLANNPFAAILQDQKWDGSLVKTDGDYLYVVNANLSGNKANYYVKPDMDYDVLSETRDGLLRGVLTLNYVHTGVGTAWPGGVYEDYVRVITQEGSKLTGARIVNPDGTEKDIFKEIIISQIGSYNSFETSFSLEPQKSIKLVFTYDLPQNLTVTKDNMNYNLYWQKQPGTQDEHYSFTFNPPFGLKTRQDKFEGSLNEDQHLYVMLDPQ